MIWQGVQRIGVKTIWKNWIKLAKKTGIKPLISVADTIERRLLGILNAMKYNVSNGRAEAINNNIKALARQSRGYRNKERYKTAIMFHFGKNGYAPHH
jgi:transposase